MDNATVLGIAVALTLLLAWRPWWGIVGLLFGIVLFDRNFAYLSVHIGFFPIYIPEIILFLYVLRSLIVAPKERLMRMKTWPCGLSMFLGIYLILGVIALLMGLSHHYPTVRVLRDSILCFNVLWLILIATEDLNDADLLRGANILFVGGLIKALLIYLFLLGIPVTGVNLVAGQTAAYSMLFSFIFLGLLILSDGLLSFWLTAASSLVFAVILLAAVRSAWTGLVGALGVSFMLLSRPGRLPLMVRRLGLSIIKIGFSVALLIYFGTLLSRHQYLFPSFPQSALHFSVNSDQPKSVANVFKPHPHDEFILLANGPSARPYFSGAASPETALSDEEVPKPPSRSLYVKDKLVSFTEGHRSPNVNTRLWMWEDAIFELFSTGMFKPGVPIEQLSQYHLPPILQREGCRAYVPVSGKDLELERVVLSVACSEPSSIPRSDHWLQNVLRPLFGFGFGKLYLPPQIVWVVNSPQRYDPHNSFVDILYRMGVLGLTTFLILIFIFYNRGFSFIRTFDSTTWQGRWAIFFMAALCMHLIHSLTDNTLENDFKGIWFWIFAGLLIRHCKSLEKSR